MRIPATGRSDSPYECRDCHLGTSDRGSETPVSNKGSSCDRHVILDSRASLSPHPNLRSL